MQQVLDAQRRSSRVPVSFPVLVTTLNPGTHFSEICETVVVSAHGCAFRSPLRLEQGAPIHLHSEEGRQTKAQVVSCQRLGPDQRGWVLGASLERPQNFWGLKSYPKDWGLQLPAPASLPQLTARGTEPSRTDENVSVKQYLDVIQRQVSDESLRERLARMLEPLRAELAEVKAKISEGKRSRFEVSLSQIPPELEEQLWLRLRKELGAQVLRQTLEQSEQVLAASKDAIDLKISAAGEEFGQHLTRELQAAEERMRGFLADGATRVRQHIGAGLEQFQQRAIEAGNSLEQKSEEILRGLTQRLTEEHEAQRWKTQQLQKALAEESARLQSQIADLRDRVGRLDEAARRLEGDFERKLATTASQIVSGAHAELQNAVQALLSESETRNAKELREQLDDACERLRTAQKELEGSVAATLHQQSSEQLASFRRTIDELVRDSGEQWRQRLATGLNAVAEMLSQQFQTRAEHAEN